MSAKQPSLLVLRHEKCTSLGMLRNIIEKNNIPFQYLNISEDERLSNPITNYSHILILGGAPSAYEDEKYPFLRYEFQLVEDALASRIPIVGICLGSQILAKVLGAKVYRGELGREAGWCEVELLDSAKRDRTLKTFPKRFKVFQFHQDTFEIPVNCIPLAKSDRYLNQAFCYDNFVWAIQFHLEMDENVISDCAIGLEKGLKDSKIYDLTIEQAIKTGKSLSPIVQPLADRFMQAFLEVS